MQQNSYGSNSNILNNYLKNTKQNNHDNQSPQIRLDGDLLASDRMEQDFLEFKENQSEASEYEEETPAQIASELAQQYRQQLKNKLLGSKFGQDQPKGMSGSRSASLGAGGMVADREMNKGNDRSSVYKNM